MTTPGAPPRDLQRELVRALRRPDAYARALGRTVARVDMRETHISWLFFAGDRVYKVKKPVDLGFLDFSTRERREHFCREELRLNRRLAGDIYVEVVPITREPDGAFVVGGTGEVEDWAVEMVRLPDAFMLDRLLDEGTVDNQLIERLARLLVDFHRDADTGPGVDEHGAPEAVTANLRDTLDELKPFAADAQDTPDSGLRVISSALLTFLRLRVERALAAHADTLRRRVEQGRIRDGHGDLHAANICAQPERLVAYDCIEFTPRFRCGDVAADLAFLAMDFDLRGFRGFSRYLVRRYAALSGDDGLLEVMDLYKTYRALVRAKVECLRAREASPGSEQRDAAVTHARHYVFLAATYHLPAGLVLTCGLPGSGKSTLAQQVSPAFEALVLRSDVRRKQLAGLPPSTRARAEFGTGLYTPEAIDHTYQVLLDEAITALERGRSVVVDATFSDPRHRRLFLDAAVRLNHPASLLYIDAPDETIRARLALRAHETGEASDASESVYEHALESFSTPDDVHPALRIDVRPDEAPDTIVARILDHFARDVSRIDEGRDPAAIEPR